MVNLKHSATQHLLAAAASHETAAHHHRDAANELCKGKNEEANHHSTVACEHSVLAAK
jgi:hypothetical protein